MDTRNEPIDPPPPVIEELLSSVFYEWSCDHFSQRLLSRKIIDEFSPQMLAKQRKQINNEMIQQDAITLHKSIY
jgi:hypothetical protein